MCRNEDLSLLVRIVIVQSSSEHLNIVFPLNTLLLAGANVLLFVFIDLFNSAKLRLFAFQVF